MTNPFSGHISVLLDPVLDFIAENAKVDHKFTMYDFTFGGGGHSMAVLDRFPNANIVAFDQDPDALANGHQKISEKKYENRISLLKGNFSDFKALMLSAKLETKPDFVLIDLGVSSHHFDEGKRGFSFRFDGPLDMRMNYLEGVSASDVINNYSAQELEQVFIKYGEIYNAKSLVEKIIDKRARKKIETTFELRDLVYELWKKKKGEIDPCTQVFQALRIEVNRELAVAESAIEEVARDLNIDGCLMVITFHSLEDRLVKQLFKNIESEEIPFEVITKKPIIPTEEEIINNRRSRSAKMRIIRRVNEKKNKNKYHQFSRKE